MSATSATVASPNPVLWIVTAGASLLLVAALYQPFLAEVFHFESLSPVELVGAFGIGLASVLWFEVLKFFRRREK